MRRIAPNPIIAFLFFVLITAVSCKKNTANTDDEQYVPPSVTAPVYSFSRYDGNGLLKMQRTLAYYDDPIKGRIETISKEAKASFKNSVFDSLYSNAGAVSCQGKTLSLLSNQTYFLDGSGATNISFKDTVGITWNVAGNTLTGIPTFLYTTSRPMPVYKGVANNSIPTTIRRAVGVTISLGANIVGADSIFLSITSGTKTIKKIVGGYLNDCEFTSTELSVLPSSDGGALLQVSPIRYDLALLGGKKMYFANQSAYTKLVSVE